MAEYIEREKVIRILNDNIGNSAIKSAVNGYPEEYFDGWTDATSEAITEVEGIPTADVRPERHGRWTDTSINLYDGSSERGYQCNVCKDIFFVEQSEIVYYKFCPHCSAKMDGKEREK